MRLIGRALHRLGFEDGATAIEYALMVALIAMVVLAAVTFLGQSTSTKFLDVGAAVNAT